MGKPRGDFINSVNLNGQTDFPYLMLDVVCDTSTPRNPGFGMMHWHEDLQFIYVLEGSIEVQTLDGTVQVEAGEALFINQSVVHLVRRLGFCYYNSFVFPAALLEFYPGSPAKAFVEDVTLNERFSLFRITPRMEGHEEPLALLRQLVDIEQDNSPFYAYEVLVGLSALWLALRKLVEIPAKREGSPVNLRMRRILRYIEGHFSDDISLADLAASANISKSECSRCFKASLNTTPYKYLVDYRLSVAAHLLKTTDDAIGRIATRVGFHQMSHFGKSFKEKTGCAPRAYRELASIPYTNHRSDEG